MSDNLLRNYINESLILPLSDFLFGRKLYTYLKFLNRSQWWSEDEILEYQNFKLHQLIDHAYANVSYYRELFDSIKLKPSDINTINDLEKIPVLTKEIFKKNFPNKLLAKNYSKKNLILSGSSGSTGQPLQYYLTKDALSFSRASNLRGWYWMGYRLGDKYIKISTIKRSKIYKKLQDKFNDCQYVHTQSLDIGGLERIVSSLKKSKAKFLRGYPATLYIIAKYIRKKGIEGISFNAINTTSEPLFPYMRDYIESTFNCKIFDSYGAEGGPIISECETHSTYHISPEKAIVEFQKDLTNPKSKMSKMLFTDITNFATPFIRYDVRDFAQVDNSKCSCGRNFLSVSKIEGRDTDILITPSGKLITFYFLAGFFEHKSHLDQFQLYQDKIDTFILKVVKNSQFKEHHKDEIRNYLLEVLGKDVKLIIDFVEDIPLTISGKRRFFIRNSIIPLTLFD